jgi:hypothetical protein
MLRACYVSWLHQDWSGTGVTNSYKLNKKCITLVSLYWYTVISLLLSEFKSRTSTVGRDKQFICAILPQRSNRLCQIFATARSWHAWCVMVLVSVMFSKRLWYCKAWRYHRNPTFQTIMRFLSLDLYMIEWYKIRYHNNVTNLIHFHFYKHFIVSYTCFGRQASIFRRHYTSLTPETFIRHNKVFVKVKVY